jgi:hypothetical protein
VTNFFGGKIMLRNALLTFFVLFPVLFTVQFTHAQLESIDIGDAKNSPGSTEFKGGKYTIIGSGSDIWGPADGFRFAYTKVSGNFEAKVHQISIELKNEWAKGGIHARQDLDPGAANAQVIVTGGGGGGCQISWRTTKGNISEELLNVSPGLWKDGECWLKLTRNGEEFNGYISIDSKDWKDLKLMKVKMTDPIYVGIAMCGMDQMGKGVYDGFTITRDGKEIFPGLAVETSGKLSTVWGKIKN